MKNGQGRRGMQTNRIGEISRIDKMTLLRTANKDNGKIKGGRTKMAIGGKLGKSRGNVGDIMTMGFCVLAMTAVMAAYLDNVELIQQKSHVGQLARSYILKMETVGGLMQEDRIMLEQELAGMGITDIDFTGTTFGEMGYGERIALNIRGRLKGGHEFEECRVSTAKN